MRSNLNIITLTFIFIALLPVGFILYELSSLNENEKIVRESYQNQLDAILYSVNQYSDDIISSWANRIDRELVGHHQSPDNLPDLLLNQMTSVQQLYFSDLQSRSWMRSITPAPVITREEFDQLINRIPERIQKLENYRSAGFKKMEPLETRGDSLLLIAFIPDENPQQVKIGIMVINLLDFIHQVLGPKMQAISGDKFVIAAFREKSRALIYSTDLQTTSNTNDLIASNANAPGNQNQQKDFWLLPGYYLAIALKGVTVNDLVKERITTSIVILSFLLVIISAGIVIVYRNIKRAMFLSQAKSEFVSNVSHEIRTPLSLISMYAESLALNRVKDEKKNEYYHVLVRETERLSRIVNRILNFSQLEANRKKYAFQSLRLNELCDEVLNTYAPQLAEKGFTLNCIREANNVKIRGDQDAVTEALVNLIDNAIKYSKDKKHITVRIAVEKQQAFLEVKDQGIGIARKHQQEIFEQFFRAPSGDIHNTKGSGLGLTLVKKTMEAHGGKVTVESSTGQGSTFRLYFPLDANPENNKTR
jgi:two-component system, OmpR family, phosphate regulon sensor histidine kinase PhoR